MSAIHRLSLMCAVLTAASPAVADTWQVENRPPVEGRLTGVYGAVAFISGKQGTGLVSLNILDDAGLARVANFLDAPPKPEPGWATATGKVALGLRNKLQVLRDGKLVAFDPGSRPEPEIYLAYFGAHWCHPCREFSPTLLEEYRQLKKRKPDRFELVFVSDDRSSDEQALYIRELGMPWPFIKYSAIGSVPSVEHANGPAIPDLVVLTRDGDVIFNSFHGAAYVGPQSVLEDAEHLLDAMDEASPACHVALHRLSVIRHIRAAAGGTRGPKPYAIAIDPSHYQTLLSKKLIAVLDIDEHGRVTDAKADPELATALEFQFEQDARGWLFLPSVVNGQPKATKARLPVSF
jgi:thiol-disulfide isomerase/thioredoxin